MLNLARRYPRLGYQKLAHILKRNGTPIGKKKVYRIMKMHNLIKSKKRFRDQNPDVVRLEALRPCGPNQVWQMDITYIFVDGYGFYYLISVVDYWSRFLLSSYFTDSYRSAEVIRSLELAREHAERLHGPLTSQIVLITDNGSSFLSKRFQEHLRLSKIDGTAEKLFQHVRIGYRSPTQLGLLERLHRTLKEEEVWPAQYIDPFEAKLSLNRFVEFYNYERPHWALKMHVPAERYLGLNVKELTDSKKTLNEIDYIKYGSEDMVPLYYQTYFANFHSHQLGG